MRLPVVVARPMPNIFRKTRKGQDEITTRAHRLAPRARAALILVDGQRNDEELARLIQVQATETLQTLLDQGFIEVSSEPVVASPVPAAAPRLATQPPPKPIVSETSNPDAPSTIPRSYDFRLVQREAVRRLTDLLGPAAETLAIRMEGCRDLAGLRPLLIQARDLITAMRGKQAGAEYIAYLSAL